MTEPAYHVKDRSGINLLAIPEILADLINNDLYDGNQYVLAENVFFIDTVLKEVKSEDGEVTGTEERIRDVRAIVIAKEPGGYVPFVFGVEPQTSQDPCMPVRNGNYDFMSVMKQLKEGRKVPYFIVFFSWYQPFFEMPFIIAMNNKTTLITFITSDLYQLKILSNLIVNLL